MCLISSIPLLTAYAKSPWSEIKNQKDDRFEVIFEKENIE